MNEICENLCRGFRSIVGMVVKDEKAGAEGLAALM